jgi:hypothetical protein
LRLGLRRGEQGKRGEEQAASVEIKAKEWGFCFHGG